MPGSLKSPRVLRIERPPMMRPRCPEGTDFGRPDPILLYQESTGKTLVWWRAGSYWSGLGGNSYRPPQLQLGDPKVRGMGGRMDYQPILKGGRLSAMRLLSVEGRIRDWFGTTIDVAALNQRQTVIIE